jgi:hypothetical protein
MPNNVGSTFSPLDSEHSQIVERQVATRNIKDPQVKQAMIQVLKEHPNLDPQIYLNQINQESRFNQGATSRVGAMGAGQIMPSTAERYGADLNQVRNDPYANLSLSAKIMEDNLKATHGDYAAALAYYNGGTRGKKAFESGNIGNAAPETQDYVSKILGTTTPPRSTNFDGGNMTKNPAAYSALTQSPSQPQAGPMSSGQARSLARSLVEELNPKFSSRIQENEEVEPVGKRFKGSF